MASEDQTREEIPTSSTTAPTIAAAIDLAPKIIPVEESAAMQQDEVQALEAIYPDEIQIKSSTREVEGETIFDFPILYHMALSPTEEDTTNT
jgi:hypothetical protein